MKAIKDAILDRIMKLDITTLTLDELESVCYILYITEFLDDQDDNQETDVLEELMKEEGDEEDVTNI